MSGPDDGRSDAPTASEGGDLPPPGSAQDTGVLDVPRPTDEHLEELDFEVDGELEREFDAPAPGIVVFDIGEVLIDETRVWSLWAEILGVSPLTFAAVLGAAVSQGEDHRAVFEHLAPNIEWEAFVDEHERRYAGFTRDDLYSDAEPCLLELKQLGFRVALAGNQPARRDQQLADLDLPCDVIATSERLGHDKPSPGFYEAVMALVDASDPGEVLYVGDRADNDVLPAMEFGMRTCWLRRGPWGWLQEMPDGLEPDLMLEGLGELPLLLQEWRGDDG
jgi:FMN phosphatase YigB (HAD superfamily)